ncbi:MAG: response regulator [Lentisphaeria bacterium]|nr:response regulator [Lentisphaeria bacterium]
MKSKFNSHTILYIDDQVDVYQSLVILLERDNFNVLTARSFNEARTHLQKHIDLILLDVKLPGIDGWEICRRLKSGIHTAHIPVIFMTVCNEEDEIQACFEVGGADYVNKNINANELLARVKTQLRMAEVINKEKSERKLLSVALNNMLDMVMVIDKDGEILFANLAAENYFNQNINSMNIYSLAKEQKELCGLPIIEKVLSSHEAINQIVTQDAEVRDITVLPIRSADGQDIEALFVMNRDVSDEREMEAQIRQAQKMASVGRLAGGIAHDLNNILGGMVGYLSLVKAKTSPNDSTFPMIEQIENASERATDVISKLMEFSSVQDIRITDVDLNNEITKLLILFKSSIKKDVLIERRLQDRLPKVRCDESQVKQLLMNICHAASNSLPDGGVLQIATSTESNPERDDLENGLYVCIEIASDITISIENQHEYVDGYQLPENAGLGLAIVRDIVHDYNGGFYIEKQSDSNLTFTVYLPVEDNEISDEVDEVTVRDHILVIDDEPFILQMIEDCFEMLGYHGFFASNGKQGLDLYRKNRHKIGLIVLDLIMPGMSGEEVFDEIMIIDKDQKILIASAFDITQKSTLMKTADFLKKPFKLNDLQDKIEKLLHHVENSNY